MRPHLASMLLLPWLRFSCGLYGWLASDSHHRPVSAFRAPPSRGELGYSLASPLPCSCESWRPGATHAIFQGYSRMPAPVKRHHLTSSVPVDTLARSRTLYRPGDFACRIRKVPDAPRGYSILDQIPAIAIWQIQAQRSPAAQHPTGHQYAPGQRSGLPWLTHEPQGFRLICVQYQADSVSSTRI